MPDAVETTPLFAEKGGRNPNQEAPPSYHSVIKEPIQPVVPSAPAASRVQQPRQLDAYPPQPVSTDPNARTTTTTTTTTTNLTTTETHTRGSSCCPGFIFCFFIPIPCSANGDCCNCLPPTTDCCTHCCAHCYALGCIDDDCDCKIRCHGHVGIVLILIFLAIILVALIGIIAFLIYRLGDDKPPAIAKRYRIFAVVFAIVTYIILIGGTTTALLF